jgi:uncharacterized RDD family membrane protein YckC
VRQVSQRLLALIIDASIEAVLLVILAAITVAAGSTLDAASGAAVAVTAAIVVIVGYPATFETLSRGRSPGKIALGLRVVSDDGGPERFRQALVRALAAVVEIWLLSGAPALISSLLSAKGKRLGDVFAGTFVIQERLPARRGAPAALSVVPPPLAGWAAALELSGLTDHTAETAASFLRRFPELTPEARDEFGQRIAAAVAAQSWRPAPAGRATRASRRIPARRIPARQVPARQVPARQIPARQIPARQIPASQIPASQIPARQNPASQVRSSRPRDRSCPPPSRGRPPITAEAEAGEPAPHGQEDRGTCGL